LCSFGCSPFKSFPVHIKNRFKRVSSGRRLAQVFLSSPPWDPY
jgi:hypothetical protein